jgi:hypothetical protein
MSAVDVSFASPAQREEPTKWEQLFFPFLIVGAPPQAMGTRIWTIEYCSARR